MKMALILMLGINIINLLLLNYYDKLHVTKQSLIKLYASFRLEGVAWGVIQGLRLE